EPYTLSKVTRHSQSRCDVATWPIIVSATASRQSLLTHIIGSIRPKRNPVGVEKSRIAILAIDSENQEGTMKRQFCGILLTIALFSGSAAMGQVTPADYSRSEGLRDAWMYLTRNVADPPRWIGNTTKFVYRKTVPGGFAFVVMDARSGEKRPA